MRRSWISIVGIILGLYLIAYGFSEGEVNIVFSKAIKICLECIGIG